MAIVEPAHKFSTRRFFKRLDFGLLLSVLILVVAGLISVRSATLYAYQSLFGKQIVWYLSSFIVMAFLASVDPAFWGRKWKLIYFINICLLILVEIAGKEAKGAQRWIEIGSFQFQPSEFAKAMIILTLAQVIANLKEEIQTWKGLGISLIHIGIPALLIFKQPDLGTSIVVGVIWLGVVFSAGARLSHLSIVVALIIALFIAGWNIHFIPDAKTGKRVTLIKPYQKERLTAFLNPEKHAKEGGYQILQARIAIGSGKALGKGFGQGTQKKFQFIPEQHTDFVFTVVGEEGGLAGVSLLLAAFGFFFWRVWLIAVEAKSLYYRCIAFGALTLFGFHTVINIGMVIGLAPVVGVPLPFISYGGSITVVAMALVGLLVGLRARQEALLF